MLVHTNWFHLLSKVREVTGTDVPSARAELAHVPLRWREPRVIFVNSMSDLFHEQVPLPFIQRIFDTMLRCPHHTFQILTKRSRRVRELAAFLPWPEHVWMGVSVEDSHVLFRIDDLRAVPAAVRFLSCEPLIGPMPNLSLDGIHWVIVGGVRAGGPADGSALGERYLSAMPPCETTFLLQAMGRGP